MILCTSKSVSYSPRNTENPQLALHRSFWTLTGSPNLVRHQIITDLSKELGCTQAQLVYRIAQVNGVVPLAGSKNERHMKDGVLTEQIKLDGLASNSSLQALESLLFE